ncbi:hypothetical protein BT69DRAFT_1315547 [Atractiella rhizophila]|nr:hypothetical protein BT69DRAFT_1315547 [Atractiella rhizophila]
MLASPHLHQLAPESERHFAFRQYQQNLAHIQIFRLVCRRFDGVGQIALYRQIGAQTEMRGSPVFDMIKSVNIVKFLQRYQQKLVPWIRMLLLRDNDFDNRNIVWKTASMYFGMGHSIRTLVLSLRPPTKASSRQRVMYLIAQMETLDSLHIEGGRTSDRLSSLYLVAWDLLDFEEQPDYGSVKGNLKTFELVKCKVTASFIRWASRLCPQLVDLAFESFWPSPHHETESFKSFLLDVRESVTEIRLRHLPITTDTVGIFGSASFLEPLDVLSSCCSLSWLYIDCGGDSNLVSPSILETLHCPKLVTLYLFSCCISLEKILAWAERQDKATAPQTLSFYWGELWGAPETEGVLSKLEDLNNVKPELYGESSWQTKMGNLHLHVLMRDHPPVFFRW